MHLSGQPDAFGNGLRPTIPVSADNDLRSPRPPEAFLPAFFSCLHIIKPLRNNDVNMPVRSGCILSGSAPIGASLAHHRSAMSGICLSLGSDHGDSPLIRIGSDTADASDPCRKGGCLVRSPWHTRRPECTASVLQNRLLRLYQFSQGAACSRVLPPILILSVRTVKKAAPAPLPIHFLIQTITTSKKYPIRLSCLFATR